MLLFKTNNEDFQNYNQVIQGLNKLQENKL